MEFSELKQLVEQMVAEAPKDPVKAAENAIVAYFNRDAESEATSGVPIVGATKFRDDFNSLMDRAPNSDRSHFNTAWNQLVDADKLWVHKEDGHKIYSYVGRSKDRTKLIKALEVNPKATKPEKAVELPSVPELKNIPEKGNQSACAFEQPYEKQDTKFANDKDGKLIAQLASDIVKKATGKKPPDPPFERGTTEDPTKRTWTIYGAPGQRAGVSEELAQTLRSAPINLEAYSSQDDAQYKACYGSHLPSSITRRNRGVRVHYWVADPKGGKDKKEHWDFIFNPLEGATKNYSTNFEGNLIYAINVVGGSADPAEGAGARNDDQASDDIAKKIITSVFKNDNPKKASRASGGAVDTSLSKEYLKLDVSSEEAKTDIFIWFEKIDDAHRKSVSVKGAHGAQYASAQGPEAVAIFQAAFKSSPEAKTYWEELNTAINLLGSRAAADGIATFDARKKEYMKVYGGDDKALGRAFSKYFGIGKLEDEEDAEKVYSKLDAIARNEKSATEAIDTMKIKKAKELEALNEKDREAWVEKQNKYLTETTLPTVSKDMRDTLEKDSWRILKEAITGEFKFTAGSAAIADAILVWDDSGAKSQYIDLKREGEYDDNWFKKHAKATKFDFRSRGGSGLSARGIAFRVEPLGTPGKVEENKNIITQEMQDSADLYWQAMLLTEGPWRQHILTEGFLDKAKEYGSAFVDQLKNVGEWGKKIYNKLSQMAKQAWEAIKKFATELYEKTIKWVKGETEHVVNGMKELGPNFDVWFDTLFYEESATIGDPSAEQQPDIKGLQERKHLTKTPLSYIMLREMIENLMSEE